MDVRQKTACAIWPWGVTQPEQMVAALTEIQPIGYQAFESVKQAIYCYDFDAPRFQEVTDRFGIRAVSFYFHMSGDWKADCATLPKELRFVKQLGIETCCLQAASNNGVKPPVERIRAATEEIRAYARIAKDAGLTFCLHPHIFTECMYEDEIDYMMQHLAPDELAMAPDTAHLMAGGSDPVAVMERYKERIGFMHLKDFEPSAAMSTRAQEGMQVEVYKCFAELGAGVIDFAKVFAILKSVDFNGYLCNELDTAPVSNAASAAVNYRFVTERYGA